MWAIEGITLPADMFIAKRRRLRKLPPQSFREGCEGRDVRHRQKIVRPPSYLSARAYDASFLLCCCPEKHPLQKTSLCGQTRCASSHCVCSMVSTTAKQ